MEGLRSGAPPFAPARLGSARGGSASRPAPVPLPALRPRPRGEAERGARSIAREEEEEGGGKSEKKPCPDPAGGERKVAAASRSAVAAQRGFRDPRPAAWTPGPQDGSQRRASPGKEPLVLLASHQMHNVPALSGLPAPGIGFTAAGPCASRFAFSLPTTQLRSASVGIKAPLEVHFPATPLQALLEATHPMSLTHTNTAHNQCHRDSAPFCSGAICICQGLMQTYPTRTPLLHHGWDKTKSIKRDPCLVHKTRLHSSLCDFEPKAASHSL